MAESDDVDVDLSGASAPGVGQAAPCHTAQGGFVFLLFISEFQCYTSSSIQF